MLLTFSDQLPKEMTIYLPGSSAFWLQSGNLCQVSNSSIVNSSVLQSCVPLQWKTAVIYPVPKIPKPTSPVDYRPISVVPILSRIVECIIVHSYLYPALLTTPLVENIKEQFAFRPTGSTTAAVIDLLQNISTMLQSNEYVLIISLDLSKAFDRVRHPTLLQKGPSINDVTHQGRGCQTFCDDA